jgi:hypothetical protein
MFNGNHVTPPTPFILQKTGVLQDNEVNEIPLDRVSPGAVP